MSLSKAPTVKITSYTPQDISDEILGGAIHFCREAGYGQNRAMLTFFWTSFLLPSKEILEENGILNSTLNCYTDSLGKVFPRVSEDDELQENIKNMQQQYWNWLCIDFESLRTEAEITSLIKFADNLNNHGDKSFTGQSTTVPTKTYSRYASNISSSIYRILHDIDNGICIQYKFVLDEFHYVKSQERPDVSTVPSSKIASEITPPATNNANEQPLGMKWYNFLIYFALIAGAIINLIYSFSYISGGVYFVETNGTVSAEQVYAYYGTGLQIVDILYGFFLIAFAILAFVIRHKLANYTPDSLKYVKIFYAISTVTPFLYTIVVSMITGQSLTVEAVIWVISGFVFWALQIKYFKKRAHLFVDKTVSAQPPIQPQHEPTYKTRNIPVVTKSTISGSPAIVFCRKCGTKLHENSAFCHKCGTKAVPDSPKEYHTSYHDSYDNTPGYENIDYTFDQYILAVIISDDPQAFCKYISELHKILSKSNYSIDLQKEKATEYVNGLLLDYGQRIILLRILFPSDTTYCGDIVDYINEREEISYNAAVFVLKELDFAVLKDGTITW